MNWVTRGRSSCVREIESMILAPDYQKPVFLMLKHPDIHACYVQLVCADQFCAPSCLLFSGYTSPLIDNAWGSCEYL
jgi:hypothetical protein